MVVSWIPLLLCSFRKTKTEEAKLKREHLGAMVGTAHAAKAKMAE